METTSAIVCDPAIAIAEDRTIFYLKAGFHMIADHRRPYCSAIRDHMETSLKCDRNLLAILFLSIERSSNEILFNLEIINLIVFEKQHT